MTSKQYAQSAFKSANSKRHHAEGRADDLGRQRNNIQAGFRGMTEKRNKAEAERDAARTEAAELRQQVATTDLLLREAKNERDAAQALVEEHERTIESHNIALSHIRRWLVTGMHGTDFHKVQAFMEIGRSVSELETALANALPFDADTDSDHAPACERCNDTGGYDMGNGRVKMCLCEAGMRWANHALTGE